MCCKMDPKWLFWLSERTTYDSDESNSTSSWSDVRSVKYESSVEDDDQDNSDKLFFPLMHHFIRRRQKRDNDYIHIIEFWSETEFKRRLRVSRRTASRLIDELQKSGMIASHKFGMTPLDPKVCFYIFLTFIAGTEPLTPIATRFDISISSTYRVIKRVISFILTKLDEAIKWPNDCNEIRSTCDSFYSKINITNVLGVIDTTHIKIIKPKNGRVYCNKRGCYSIVLQATVDSNMRFTNVFCGEPGSISSARVLKRSPLFKSALQNNGTLFPQNTYLIAHSGYPALPWLLLPFRENQRLTQHQKEFNVCHTAARKISEKAFNVLKNRFQRLKVFNVYRNISFTTDTVVAACILHNYCMEENDYLDA